jgi:hypothetical protein
VIVLNVAEGVTTMKQDASSRAHAFGTGTLRDLLESVLSPNGRVSEAAAHVDDAADDADADIGVDDATTSMIDELCSHYVNKYDDVKYYTLDALR